MCLPLPELKNQEWDGRGKSEKGTVSLRGGTALWQSHATHGLSGVQRWGYLLAVPPLPSSLGKLLLSTQAYRHSISSLCEEGRRNTWAAALTGEGCLRLFFTVSISQWCSWVIPRPHRHCQTGFHGDRVLSPMRLGLPPWGLLSRLRPVPQAGSSTLTSNLNSQLWL